MSEQTQHGLAGIILAGGRSRRMGQDKASLEWEGRPMLQVIAESIGERCTPVMVAAPATSQAYDELAGQSELAWITDEQAGSGPLGGIVAALTAAKEADASAAFVCATDLPLVSSQLIDELLHALTGTPDVVIPFVDGRDHPLAGIYRVRALPALQAKLASGDVLMRDALEAVVTHRVGVSDPRWLTNVDAPEDLHRLRTA
ncbi:molybdenum cofactor guanylyltransferase [Gordonia iterans]|uniref:Probable molybdenum cofactor guanylyltransferase n=1 Tax=Gordonia iterans TaxID=1004901 RepID=A0A2S0KF88_9ACTN|nr:molybdenum cofactor guanylyltransferase [Gordonia iterans]AVM00345.1 molybdenum cofactor guanylyltransferase [Gordonia iterans]